MKMMFKRLLSFSAGLALLVSCASAETFSFNGTVIADHTAEVYAPIGGTVGTVSVKAGQQVQEDTVLCQLKTNKVYASKSGTVTGVFGVPGDSADEITATYGGVLYLQNTNRYIVSATTEEAYNSAETRFVSVGETVYLTNRTGSSRKGEGIITSVTGSAYKIEVTSGNLQMDDTVDVYRSSSRRSDSRLGRGTVSRNDPTAVAASGSIVSVAVKNGDTVSRGDLLFETLTGSYDGADMPGTEITAGVSGVVSQINVQQGGSIVKDGVVAVIYPSDAMQIQGTVYESNLADIAVGDPVSIEMTWNEENDVTYQGTVAMISSTANASTGDNVSYTVYVDFTPDADTRFGMSVYVTTLDGDAEAQPEAEEEAPAEETPAE